VHAAVLYYGNQGGGGLKATDFVPDLMSRQELADFVHGDTAADPSLLSVVNVSTAMCKPCIKVYPAVMALARNFKGHVHFGRFLGDSSVDTERVMAELGILEVPTFSECKGVRGCGF
jgi:hypothetical protein